MTSETKRQMRIGNDITVFEVARRQCGGTWVQGTTEAYRFCALVFSEHADNPDWEIEQSRISKLWLQRIEDGRTVYNWDRGLDVAAENSAVQAVVRSLVAELAACLDGKQ